MPCGFLLLKVSDIRNNGGNVDLQEYINSFGKKKVPAGIQERWQTRIVTRGLAEQGAVGAQQYLADYGKSIGAPKVAMLALRAQKMGFPEMAMAFWKKAYSLQFGAVPVDAAVHRRRLGGGRHDLGVLQARVEPLRFHRDPVRIGFSAPDNGQRNHGDVQFLAQLKIIAHPNSLAIALGSWSKLAASAINSALDPSNSKLTLILVIGNLLCIAGE